MTSRGAVLQGGTSTHLRFRAMAPSRSPREALRRTSRSKYSGLSRAPARATVSRSGSAPCQSHQKQYLRSPRMSQASGRSGARAIARSKDSMALRLFPGVSASLS